MDVQIRQSTMEDDAKLASISRQCWSPDVSPTPPADEGALFFDDHRSPANCWAATVDDDVVGYVLVGAGHPISSHEHVAFIRALDVAEHARGRGVGRTLLRHAVGELARRGARKVRSNVLSTNPASLAMHRACGFVEEGRLCDEFRITPIGSVDDVLLAFHFDDPPRP